MPGDRCAKGSPDLCSRKDRATVLPITRRTLLRAASLIPLVAGDVAAQPNAVPARAVALDWASSETLLSLGVAPIAITERDRFLSANPAFAARAPIHDLGAPWEPNLELIDALAPSIIYTSSYTKMVEPQLRRISNVVVTDLHGGRRGQLARCADFARTVVTAFPGLADGSLLAAMEQTLARNRAVLSAPRHPPVLCVYLHSNGRFANVFGSNSFAGNVVAHVGLANAWVAPTNSNGFDYVGIEKLAAISSARMLVLGDGAKTERALKTLKTSALWNAIPAVKAGEVRLFPDVAMYGALPTAVRFSQMLVDEFAREKPDAG